MIIGIFRCRHSAPSHGTLSLHVGHQFPSVNEGGLRWQPAILYLHLERSESLIISHFAFCALTSAPVPLPKLFQAVVGGSGNTEEPAWRPATACGAVSKRSTGLSSWSSSLTSATLEGIFTFMMEAARLFYHICVVCSQPALLAICMNKWIYLDTALVSFPIPMGVSAKFCSMRYLIVYCRLEPHNPSSYDEFVPTPVHTGGL